MSVQDVVVWLISDFAAFLHSGRCAAWYISPRRLAGEASCLLWTKQHGRTTAGMIYLYFPLANLKQHGQCWCALFIQYISLG